MKFNHMKYLKITLLILLFSPFLHSCEKELDESFSDIAIIEGYLDTKSPFNITVSRQIPFEENVTYSSDDIDNLTIELSVNNNLHLLTPVGNGLYVDSTLFLSESDNFNISFTFNSKEVTAYTYMPTKPENYTQSATVMYIAKFDTTSGPPSGGFSPPDPIELNWTNEDNSYYLVLVENTEPDPEPIRDFGDNEPPGNIFKKTPTTASSEELRSLEFQYFGLHRIILYHVLPDYASLYDENSTSSQNITNPSSSIVNGYGIFTGLNSDTLYVNVLED